MYILFSVDHFSIFSKSLERAWVKEVTLFQSALRDRVISSAYISMVELFKCKGISFTNKRNKIGLRIDPCGPPCLTGFGSDFICPSFTNCRRSSRYDRNQATLSGLATNTDNFFSSRLWLITSNALRKSTNTSPVTSSLSILNKISSVILIRAVSVEWPERKADCNSFSKLFSWRYFNSDFAFATCFSMILHESLFRINLWVFESKFSSD